MLWKWKWSKCEGHPGVVFEQQLDGSKVLSLLMYCLKVEFSVCTYGDDVFSCTVLVLYIRQIPLMKVFGSVRWCNTLNLFHTEQHDQFPLTNQCPSWSVRLRAPNKHTGTVLI